MGACGYRQLWGCLTRALRAALSIQKQWLWLSQLNSKTVFFKCDFFTYRDFFLPVKMSFVSSYQSWDHFKRTSVCWAVLFVCFLSAPGLSLGLWDLVPWPGIEPRPPAMWVQSPTHWTNPPPKIRIISWSYHAGRTLWLSRSPRFS